MSALFFLNCKLPQLKHLPTYFLSMFWMKIVNVVAHVEALTLGYLQGFMNASFKIMHSYLPTFLIEVKNTRREHIASEWNCGSLRFQLFSKFLSTLKKIQNKQVYYTKMLNLTLKPDALVTNLLWKTFSKKGNISYAHFFFPGITYVKCECIRN